MQPVCHVFLMAPAAVTAIAWGRIGRRGKGAGVFDLTGLLGRRTEISACRMPCRVSPVQCHVANANFEDHLELT